MNAEEVTIELHPFDNERLARLSGPFDEHLRLIERRLGVAIAGRGNVFSIEGPDHAAKAAAKVIKSVYRYAEHHDVSLDEVHLQLQESGVEERLAEREDETVLKIRRGAIRARGPNQAAYVRGMQHCDINFGVGPAGTGKTYLAVAAAVHALESQRVQRLVLARPAVEAGERLGFLPGDLAQKVDPYLRPLYDALFEMLGFERVGRLIDRNVIEVAPLAFMRGRTLNDAFVILDEAQNTTIEQMKMFLTRIGFGSRAAITGDVTQVDLPRNQVSGLKHAHSVLGGADGINFVFFDSRDVVRHPLVQRIVRAYEAHAQPAS